MIFNEIVKNLISTLSIKPNFYREIILLCLRIEVHLIVILPDVYRLILVLKALGINFELTHDSLIMPSNSFPYVPCMLYDQIHWRRRITLKLFENMPYLNSILFFVKCNDSLLKVMSFDKHFPRINMP